MAKTVRPWHSIRTRVVLTTLAVFVAGLWAMSFYASRGLRDDMARLIGQQQFSTVSYIGSQIDYELSSRVEALERVARTITPHMLEDPYQVQGLLDSRIVLLMQFNGGILVFDTTGTCIALQPFDQQRINANFIDREHVAGALRDGRPTVSSPYVGRFLKSTLIGIAVPIRTTEGRIIGALGGLIDIGKTNFLTRITNSSYAATGNYFLVDNRARRVIAATNRAYFMESLPPKGTSPVFDRLSDGYEGTLIGPAHDGGELLVSARTIPMTGWTISASLPTETAFAPIRERERHVIIAAVLLTLIAGVVALLLLRRQLAPLQSTAEQLARMAAEDAPLTPLTVRRQDEIGQVIDGFNRLLQTVVSKEKALHESEQNLRLIFENSGDAIFFSWRDGCIDHANPAACAMFGYNEEEFASLPAYSLFDPADDRLAAAQQRQRTLGKFYGEIRCIARGGRVFTGEIHSTTRHTPDGRHLTVDIVRNVSERKLAENELEQHRHHLAELSPRAPPNWSLHATQPKQRIAPRVPFWPT